MCGNSLALPGVEAMVRDLAGRKIDPQADQRSHAVGRRFELPIVPQPLADGGVVGVARHVAAALRPLSSWEA
jgi:hypothetical protein